MKNLLRPTYTAPNVEALPEHPDALKHKKLVIFDVDGTLTDYHGAPDERVRAMLIALSEKGLWLSIASKAYGGRLEELDEYFGQPFGMPIYCSGQPKKWLDLLWA